MRLGRRHRAADTAEEWTLPYRATLTWLPPDEGGRQSGPCEPPPERGFYAATAFVPPRTVQEVASFLLRGYDPTGWASPAEGRWLVPGVEAFQEVAPGDELVVTEGARPVARFLVEAVDPSGGGRSRPHDGGN